MARQLLDAVNGLDEFDYWNVIAFRDGTVLRAEWFLDRAEALKAAGLSE